MTIWNIFQPFGLAYGHLESFVVIWYIFSRFGMFGKKKNLATLCCSASLEVNPTLF
jgi:hypothetical protein